MVDGNYWGLVIRSLGGGAFAVFVMVFEGARRSFLSSKWSVWKARGVLAGKLVTEVDYGSIWSLETGPRWRYVGPKLEPCCGQVGTFLIRNCIFGGVDRQCQLE